NPKQAKNFAVRLRVPNRTTSKLYTPSPEVNGIVSLSVNGKKMQPTIEKGYAVIKRDWKTGDKIEMELPLKVQRVTASDKIAATKDRIALRYGALIYNIEKADQDITKPISANGELTTEWRSDLLGGVMAINGKFADGSKLLAIPNYARTNRDQDLPPEAGPLAADPSFYLGPNPATPPQQEPGQRFRRPPSSIVWIQKT